MKYMLLIYADEKAWAGMSDARASVDVWRIHAVHRRHSRRAASTTPAPRCSRPATATSVRVRDGKRTVTDGPFAETREQLGGYYLVEAKDLDEAIALAARIPGARVGTIEVRPVLEAPAPVGT